MSANRARGNMAKLFVGVMVLNLIPLLAFAADKAVDAPTWPGKDTKAVESKPAKKPSNKTKGGGVKTVDGKAPEKTPEAPTPSFSSMTLEEMSDPVSGFGGFKVVAIPNADKRDAAREVSLVGMIDRRCAYEKPGESTEAKFSFTQIKELKNGNIGFQLDDKDGSIRKCMKEHPASSCRK
ncbi:MAG: hypothetical protein ACXWPM_10240, partial [Bdellovibrionota bacterium]